MKVYADTSVRRTLQVAGDLLLLLWIWLWWAVSQATRDATLALAAPGRQLESSGTDLADGLRGAGDRLQDVPLVGDQLGTPFDAAGGAADQIADAGAAQVQAVETLAFWLGLAVFLIPVLTYAALYLPPRIRFAIRATAGQRFVDSARDLDLFALRAMARQPLHRLAKISADPAGDWRSGDPDVVRRLAELELRHVGLRLPERAA